MSMRISFILAGIVLAGSAFADTNSIMAGYRRTPLGMVATPRARTAPVYTIVIDLRYISAADVALLFGGRYVPGNHAMISNHYPGGYSQVRPYRHYSPWTTRGYHGTRTIRCPRR